jgi:hypothetical protein
VEVSLSRKSIQPFRALTIGHRLTERERQTGHELLIRFSSLLDKAPLDLDLQQESRISHQSKCTPELGRDVPPILKSSNGQNNIEHNKLL